MLTSEKDATDHLNNLLRVHPSKSLFFFHIAPRVESVNKFPGWGILVAYNREKNGSNVGELCMQRESSKIISRRRWLKRVLVFGLGSGVRLTMPHLYGKELVKSIANAALAG